MSAVSLDELRNHLRQRTARVVNVLATETFRIARIPGSVSLPLEAIGERAGQVLPDRNHPVIVYCGGPT